MELETLYKPEITNSFCNKKNKDKIRIDLNNLILTMSTFRYYYDLVKELDKEIGHVEVYKEIYNLKYPAYNPDTAMPDYVLHLDDAFMYITYDIIYPMASNMRKYYYKLKGKVNKNEKKIQK